MSEPRWKTTASPDKLRKLIEKNGWRPATVAIGTRGSWIFIDRMTALELLEAGTWKAEPQEIDTLKAMTCAVVKHRGGQWHEATEDDVP